MSDEAAPGVDDAADARAEIATLRDQLKAARIERDRQVADKSEVVAKANAFSRERDEFRDRLSEATAERDRLAASFSAERAQLASEKAGALKQVEAATRRIDENARRAEEANRRAEDASRRAEEAARRADEAKAEVARLQHVIDTTPSSDPLVVFRTLVSEKTKAAVAWVRGKIPADSPALPWFDRTIETATSLGCLAIRTAKQLFRWALPRLVDLFNRLKSEVEARVAKK